MLAAVLGTPGTPGTPWQPPSCGAASIMTTLVLTAINSSLLEQRPAPESCVRDSYDFVVVGGGSAGCVLASRLSEDPRWSVLLLEAGGEQPEVSKIPGYAYDVRSSPHLNWLWTSEPQSNGVCTSGCKMDLGKGLGGGSAINDMIYVRGNKHDFDYWNSSAWTFEKVLPFFKKSENNRDPDVAEDTTYHSTGGPLSVQRMLYQDQNIGIMSKSLEEMGLPQVDFNGEEQLGQGLFQFTVDGSRRDSTNSAFLDRARRRKNLRVETQAFVTKVQILRGLKRATGVTYLDKDGVERTVRARKEVVLSAGATASPQLLMLSGVGPADHLREMGIPVVVDLPAVGQNLQDHSVAPAVTFQLNNTATEPADLSRRMEDLMGYLQLHAGPVTSAGLAQVGAFRRTAEQPQNDTRPYAQYVFAGSSVQQTEEAEADNASCRPGVHSALYVSKVSVLCFLLHPRGRGSVRLVSADPLQRPRVFFNLMQDEQDVRVHAEAIRWIAKVADTKALRDAGFQLLAPNGSTTPQQCRRYGLRGYRLSECLALAYTFTATHFVGTCGIGGVLDERLTVIGVRGLRVADASAIPLSPSGNTNAPTIMLAERAACMIRSDHDPAYTPPEGQEC